VFDGEVLRPEKPVALLANQRYSITIVDLPPDSGEGVDAWATLQSLAGSFDGPADWSSEHDHYISGAPKGASVRDD
jgi:hypothetical protein